MSRQPKSADKIYPRFGRVDYNPLVQITPFRPKTPQWHGAFDSDNLEKYYLLSMNQLYQKNENVYPNPKKTIERLRFKEKRIIQLQKLLQECKQTLKRSEKKLRFESQTKQTVRTSEYLMSQTSFQKSTSEEAPALKSKYLPIFENELGNSSSIRRVKQSLNNNVAEGLLECANQIINRLKLQRSLKRIGLDEEVFEKINGLDIRVQKGPKLQESQIGYFQTKIQKNEILINEMNEERRKMQKENMYLHSELSASHQNIADLTKKLDELREENFSQAIKVDHLQAALEQNRVQDRKYSEGQEKNQQAKQKIMQLQQDKREQPKFLKPSQFPSAHNLCSEKQLSNTGEFGKLIGIIKQQRDEIQWLKNKINSMKDEFERELGQSVEKFASEWKNWSKSALEKHANQIQCRDLLIHALQKQIAQLKVEIKTRDKWSPVGKKGPSAQPKP